MCYRKRPPHEERPVIFVRGGLLNQTLGAESLVDAALLHGLKTFC